MTIKYVDICCGLSWGDEAKGKIIANLAKSQNYNFVCRWAGGNNAGHTVYVNGNKYKTHLIPCGIFYNIPSIIGPGCVVNINAFKREIKYLEENGFNTNLIKISPKAHIISDNHIEEDRIKYLNQQGSTCSGIAPCYKDKYARLGKRVQDDDFFKPYLWDGLLYGNILCEGAQGFWLDIDYGNYPYVTSSITLPYGACSLGFSPKLIRNIYGAAKIYDTRSGFDPEFPKSLLENKDLKLIGDIGEEYGVTTGRRRIVNWLNIDKLIEAINISGTTYIVISKYDVLEEAKLFKFYYNDNLIEFENINDMKKEINNYLCNNCRLLNDIFYSNDKEIVF